MSWLKWMLVGIAAVVLLVILMLAMLGMLSSGGGHEVRHISIGQRTISISHYKDMTQESTADGVKVVADGHVIVATPETITIDGTVQSFDPAQDVEISIDEAGAIQAQAVTPGATGPQMDAPEEEEGGMPPAQ